MQLEENDGTDQGQASLNLTVPIYQGGAISSAVSQALVRQRLAVQQGVLIQRTLDERVRNAFTSVGGAISRAKALDKAVAASQKNLDRFASSLASGKALKTDVTAAQSRLTSATVERSSAIYDYLLGMLRLQAAAVCYQTS